MSSAVAANTDLANTGGTMMPAAVAVTPLTMKSRRVIMVGPSLELKLGAREQRVPPVAISLASVEDGGGIGAHDAVQLGMYGIERIGKALLGGDGDGREVEPRQPRSGRDPTLVRRPARHGGHVIEDLIHTATRVHTGRCQ